MHLSFKKCEYSINNSNTITILIDGYTTENKDPNIQWEKLINIILQNFKIFQFSN